MRKIIAVAVLVVSLIVVSSAAAKLPGGFRVKAFAPRCDTGAIHFGSECYTRGVVYNPLPYTAPLEITVCWQNAAAAKVNGAYGVGSPWYTGGCETEEDNVVGNNLEGESQDFEAACDTLYRGIVYAKVYWEGSWKPQTKRSVFIHTIC